jgi:hypothetical protein
LSDAANVTVHGISDEMTQLLCPDQERIDRVERTLWIGLIHVFDRVDNYAPKLGEGSRVEIVLMELVIQLDKAPCGVAKSIDKRRIDLVRMGGFADLPNEWLDKVRELYLDVLKPVLGDGGHVPPMSLTDDIIATSPAIRRRQP